MPVEYLTQARIGVIEVAFPAIERAEADVGEYLAWLVGSLCGEPPGLLEEFSRLRVVAGQHRDPAEPGQPVGGLRPQAELPGHPQPVEVQVPALLVVPDGLAPGAQPFGGLQLAPAVPELAEQLQAPLAMVLDRGHVAAGRRVLGASAERRGDPPSVTSGLECGQRPAGQVLAEGQVTEVGRGETEEPFRFGLPGRVVCALVWLQG